MRSTAYASCSTFMPGCRGAPEHLPRIFESHTDGGTPSSVLPADTMSFLWYADHWMDSLPVQLCGDLLCSRAVLAIVDLAECWQTSDRTLLQQQPAGKSYRLLGDCT